jgi:hypothetical protein
MNRLPQSWPGRVLWLMMAIALCWIAYRFGAFYAECRSMGMGKSGCVLDAIGSTYFVVMANAVSGAQKILTFILP